MNKIIAIGLAFFSFLIKTECQSRWTEQYLVDKNAQGSHISISYDKGYLLTGRILPSYEYTWIIKTDINGEILWEKIIGSNYSTVAVDWFAQNDLGDIYLCGGATVEGQDDPILIKLDACGEKQWCKQFATTSDDDFYHDVVSTPDNGCAAMVIQAFYPNYSLNNTGIMRFSSGGELLWQKYYQSSNQGVWDEELNDLILTPDSGFLMSGFCYYPDPDDPDLYWLHPYYIKADSLGNFEWETIVHKETAEMGGMAWQTIVNPSREFYYSCIDHYYHSDTLYTKRPAIVKIDLEGNVVGVYDLVHQNYDWGMLVSATFINDSLIAGGAGWGYNEEVPLSRAVIFDTLGNIKDSLVLLEDGYLSSTAVTYDGKLLFYNTIEEDGDFDIYLFKLTQDLEQDTFYTRPFVYDSLCPYLIASDTIVPDDCGLIVGIEEETGRPGDKEKEGELELWPNPCREVLSVKVLGLSAGIVYELVNYDIFGREVQKINVPDGQEEFQISVESYPPGVYLAVLKKGVQLIASTKFVVAR